VTNAAGGNISQFTDRCQWLAHARAAAVAAGASPVSSAVDPLGKFAYAANSGSDSVSQYNDSHGWIAHADVHRRGRSGTGSQSVAVDPSGRYVYVANRRRDRFAVHDSADGSIAPSPPPWRRDRVPQSLAVDPSGRYVYVANSGSNSVSQYAIGANGR